jgi:hypothetical protein
MLAIVESFKEWRHYLEAPTTYAPQESRWNTLLASAAAEEGGESYVLTPPTPRGMQKTQEVLLLSPYGKIPDSLTSFILDLQSKDA